MTRKSVKHGKLKELKSQFTNQICELAKHVYITRHQFRAYRHLKETLDVNEAVVQECSGDPVSTLWW